MKHLKRISMLITASLVLTMLVACHSSVSQASDATTESESSSSIEVEKKLLTVEITLPQSFFTEESDSENGKTPEQYVEDVKSEDGILGAKVNSDGSVTLTMTKSKHQEMMDSAKQGIDEMIDSYLSDESFPSVKEIEHNDNYDTYTLKVDRAAYENSWDSDGTNEPKVTVDFVDVDTGEIIDEVVYPDSVQDSSSHTDGALTSNQSLCITAYFLNLFIRAHKKRGHHF